jgi:tetratricopeptide (TPR) repeat protein
VADIFVSYTASDRDWAFWIAKELETLGHTPHVHEWEIKGSDDIYAWMERQHDAADHVLCVISDDYLKAPYSTLERNAALWQAVSKRPGFALLVVVQPCKLPTLADHFRRCELFGIPEDAVRLRFRDFMQKREALAAAAFPGKVFAISNIPVRVPEHFLGREDSLIAIATALGRHDGRVAITALHGLRGVGKTTLAAAYAEGHRDDYRVTWWIRAATDSTIRADLVALGVRLNWAAPDESEELALAAVLERLRDEGGGILLVYDNAIEADHLKPYLPRGGVARLLITSNSHAWRGVAAPIEISVWPKDVGADFLVARTDREGERAAAEALSEVLGGLPLAHEQAAAYCEQLDVSLADYRMRFSAAPIRLLSDGRYAPIEYYDGRTVAKTFALAIEEAVKRHPAAELLIVRAALMAPEPIPLFLFAEARGKFDKQLASTLTAEGLDEAVAALRAFALVKRSSIADDRDPSITTAVVQLHRLVREVASSRGDECTRNRLRGELAAALTTVYPIDGDANPASWSRCAMLTPHLLTICENDTAGAITAADRVDLLNRAGNFFYGRAAYSGARPLYERALAISDSALGVEHPETTRCLKQLARLLQAQGDFVGARPLYERALAICENTIGPDHPDTAQSLFFLAGLLRAQGDLAGARPLSERALAICEKIPGAERSITATALSNLASLLRAQGDLRNARPLYERALAIYERAGAVGAMAQILNNLALLLQAQGDLAAARTLFERALAIREKESGPEHPETAMSLGDLAGLIQARGELAAARPLFERALAINEKVLGREHPNTATSLNNLAVLLQAQGDLAAARPLFERALAIREKVLGSTHPSTSASACVTAEALDALGRGNEAAALREKYAIAGEDTKKQ